jgi:hypothetical protein
MYLRGLVPGPKMHVDNEPTVTSFVTGNPQPLATVELLALQRTAEWNWL